MSTTTTTINRNACLDILAHGHSIRFTTGTAFRQKHTSCLGEYGYSPDKGCTEFFNTPDECVARAEQGDAGRPPQAVSRTACAPIANPCLREQQHRAAGTGTYDEITACRQCSALSQDKLTLVRQKNIALLANNIALLTALEELEGQAALLLAGVKQARAAIAATKLAI